jgi:hypothetical protein
MIYMQAEGIDLLVDNVEQSSNLFWSLALDHVAERPVSWCTYFSDSNILRNLLHRSALSR